MMVSVTELTPTTGFIEPPTPDLFVKLQAIVEQRRAVAARLGPAG